MEKMIIEATCISCGQVYELEVNFSDYEKWINEGALTQDAFPYLSAGERELLISGLCDACWESMFPADDD